MKFVWELLSQQQANAESGATSRVMVIGGWLVKDINHYQGSLTQTMVFVADPNHEWSIHK